MIGMFGNIGKVRKLRLEPDVVYVGLDKIQKYEENVVPLFGFQRLKVWQRVSLTFMGCVIYLLLITAGVLQIRT